MIQFGNNMPLNNPHIMFIIATICMLMICSAHADGNCSENETMSANGTVDYICHMGPGDNSTRNSSRSMGCRCKPGYVRYSTRPNASCILPAECPVDLEAECMLEKGNWIEAGTKGCEKSCISPDICIHNTPLYDTCFCGLHQVREYWPNGDCIYRHECGNEANSAKSQWLYMLICTSVYMYLTHMN